MCGSCDWLARATLKGVGLLLVASGVAFAQASSTPRFTPSLTPDGQPDIQGMYQGGDSTSIEPGINMNPTGAYDRIWGQADRPGAALTPPAPGQAPAFRSRTDAPDGSIPYQPWAAAKKKALRDGMMGDPKGAKNLETIDPVGRCLPAGVPRSNYTYGYNGYQILQPPGYVVILSEWNHMYRAIPLDGRPHLPSKIRLWMGDSRGHWEGNTLVVDVTNSNGKTWMDMAGTFHTDALHVVERYTIVSADKIQYEATIEDGNVFTRPWKLFATLDRAEKGYELYEYACAEGNHLLDNILPK